MRKFRIRSRYEWVRVESSSRNFIFIEKKNIETYFLTQSFRKYFIIATNSSDSFGGLFKKKNEKKKTLRNNSKLSLDLFECNGVG